MPRNLAPISRYGRALIKSKKAEFAYATVIAALESYKAGDKAEAFAGASLMDGIPISKALKDNPANWKPAMREELLAQKETGSYQLIFGTLPGRLITTKWLLKHKYRRDGLIARYKARLVIRGFEQRKGIDFNETFAPIIRYTTLRILLSLAAAQNLEVKQIDVNIAFLIPKLKEDVYIEIPQFME
jgi:hypothetical protein